MDKLPPFEKLSKDDQHILWYVRCKGGTMLAVKNTKYDNLVKLGLIKIGHFLYPPPPHLEPRKQTAVYLTDEGDDYLDAEVERQRKAGELF